MQRIGIIGAGQLGQMLGIAGNALGARCTFLDPSPSPPAATAGTVIRAAYDDREALRQLAECSDVITYEFENVPVDALRELDGIVPVRPSPDALYHAQDRAHEKKLFEKLDIPLASWHSIDCDADLDEAVRTTGLPLVLKTRRFGYDGKGQALVRTPQELAAAMRNFEGQSLVAERWIPFELEVSAIGARRTDGASVTYPLTCNEHRDGILRTSRAPAGDAVLLDQATDYLSRLMIELDYAGVLALEFFVVDGKLLANEYAPRVHNSGHWTIEGASTSQFENHLRAILDLPLGATTARGHAAMVNLIGAMPASPDTLTAAGMHVHDYGKAPRPGRKLGHVTIVEQQAHTRDSRLARLDAMLGRI